MNDFLKDVIKSARDTAENLISTLEKLVEDTKPTDTKSSGEESTEAIYKSLYEEYRNRWEAVSDELEEAQEALKLFLDGEVSKTFVVPAERHQTLKQYQVETFWTDPVDAPMALIVKQRKL
jgi:uncharacterized Zn finger protein